MIIIFQSLFIFFAAFAVFSVISRRKSASLSGRAALFWVLFWILAAFVVLWPGSTSLLASFLGIGRGTDLVIYISLAVIFFLIFRLNVKLEMVNRDLTKMVRHEALRDRKKE